MANKLGGVMKKLLRIVAVVSALILVPMGPAAADDFIPKGVADESKGIIGAQVLDLPNGPSGSSLVHNYSINNDGQHPFCNSTTTETCKGADTPRLGIYTMLPVCGAAIENCIESLAVYKTGAEPTAAKYVKNTAGVSFPANAAIGTPAGSTPSIWDAPSAPNASGSSKYVAIASLRWTYELGKLKLNSFSARIEPVVEKSGSRYKPMEIQFRERNGKVFTNHDNGDSSMNAECVATDTNYCAAKVQFAPDTRVTLKLRLSKKVTGWLHGRMGQPNISVEALNSEFNAVTVDASPVEVPQLYTTVELAKQSKPLQQALNASPSTGGIWGVGTWRHYAANGFFSVFLTRELADDAKDTASNVVTSWTVDSLRDVDTGNKCLNSNSKLVGLVTTNAMAYSGSAPLWKGGFLNYDVAGTHYLPDGETLAEGSYDLAIRSDVARCMYGFSKAPISASISVVGSKGEKKVATTTVSEKNGWLKLAAYGFTFSSPKIRVKLTQKKR